MVIDTSGIDKIIVVKHNNKLLSTFEHSSISVVTYTNGQKVLTIKKKKK